MNNKNVYRSFETTPRRLRKIAEKYNIKRIMPELATAYELELFKTVTMLEEKVNLLEKDNITLTALVNKPKKDHVSALAELKKTLKEQQKTIKKQELALNAYIDLCAITALGFGK